ncbi:MAG: hypothetical protein JO328_10920 [Hyphomicrobiales bacterium]|nr:hypothetical protein [Hyphomicrobiales bacterium]MBV8827160.1 hypothetical protein [Hyphomicrobiales bacterium]MBV9427942.1 hypothetical protein [Bradyrhizobiaceae bacterium]
MFEDLIPSAQAQTPAPPSGLFDDLIPRGGAGGGAVADAPSTRSAASPPAGLFDDLIPAGGAAAGTAAGVSSETAPSVGSVLKQFAIGIPEGAMNMAGAVNDAMTLQPVQHAILSALFGESEADALAPSESKLLHQALPAVANPQNYPARNFAERVARGVGEGMPAVAIPGGPVAGRVLTQTLAGGTGALAAEAVPDSYKEAAQFAGNLIGAGIPALRSAVLDAIERVGVPPEHIDPADIEGLARSVTRRDLLNFSAFKRQVIGDAAERGFVTPQELEQNYGKATADEYRGASTSANGEAAPPQGADRDRPGSDAPEGQQFPGPGENGGGSPRPADATPSIQSPPADAERGTAAGSVETKDTGTPSDAPRPEEAVRSGEITSAEPSGPGTTGPPLDQAQPPQNGVPSGAVSIFRGQEVEGVPSHRLAGQPPDIKKPPIGDDGEKAELHHVGQVQDGRIKAMTQTEHRVGDNFKKNHPNTGKKASLIDRVLSRSFREGYWEQQSKAGAFDNLPRLSQTQIDELKRAARAQRKLPEQRSDE